MIRYLRTVSRKNLKGTALLRLDFNASDDFRIKEALPTIRFLLKCGARILMLGHRGHPSHIRLIRGVPRGGNMRKFSLRKDAEFLGKLLRKPVTFVPHFSFREIQEEIFHAPQGSLFLLENTRFLKGEDENSRELARAFASLGNYYVNDAFAVSHRKVASVSAITTFLPSYAGFGLEREIKNLSHLLLKPKHPFVVVVGGAKIGDKLGVLLRFRNKADYFLVGGGAANILLAMRGVNVGKSLTERNPAVLKKIRPLAKSNQCIVPVDWKVEKDKIVDIGSVTASRFAAILKNARMIVWNGPMGIIERKKFALGTLRVARAIATNKTAFSIVGGGETAVFIKQYKLDRKFSFVSTGGGAMLEFLAGKKLPGIEGLKRK